MYIHPIMIHLRLLFTLLPLFGAVNLLSGQINWLSWEEAQSLNEQEPRKIIVDVYIEGCGWCKKMDKETFTNEEIADYINANFRPVKFDAGYKEDIELKGRVYKYIRTSKGGYHELASEIMFTKMSFPTIVFLDEEFNILQPIPGYKNPGSLDKIMKYYAEDYHKTTSWKKYEEMYQPTAPKTVPVKSNGS